MVPLIVVNTATSNRPQKTLNVKSLRACSVTPILKQINADLFGVTADQCGVTLDNTIKPFAGSSEVLGGKLSSQRIR